MPELAELRLTADYINKCSHGEGPGIHYTKIEKNPNHKGTHCITPESPKDYFSLSAESRGKELIVYIKEGNNVDKVLDTLSYAKSITGKSKP